MTGSKPHARDAFLDILKGICILFVIVTHFSWTEQERLCLLFPFWIDAAMPLFMMVSGLCYARSYANRGIVFLEAYRYRNIADKVVRYTVPFLCPVVYKFVGVNLASLCVNIVVCTVVGIIFYHAENTRF